MIEEITTNIIQCDGPNCDEVYFECVPNDATVIAALAKRDGWNVDCVDLWLCPACQLLPGNTVVDDLMRQIEQADMVIRRMQDGKFTKDELDHIATTLPPDDLTLALLQARRAVAEREGDAP